MTNKLGSANPKRISKNKKKRKNSINTTLIIKSLEKSKESSRE